MTKKQKIKVAVYGAAGRMGRSVVAAVSAEPDMEITGAMDMACVGMDSGELAGVGANAVMVTDSTSALLKECKPDVIVDFTIADGFGKRATEALRSGARLVVGTTGVDAATLKKIMKTADEKKIGVLIAPNFAIGAVLMMQFSEMAAKYLPDAEIIEYHHNRKLDAPSGTAMATLEKIAKGRQGAKPGADPTKLEKVKGARGGRQDEVSVHAVRLEGFLASQEVIFGGKGQTLRISHDTISRDSFMPGVVFAVRKIVKEKGYVFGLENLL